MFRSLGSLALLASTVLGGTLEQSHLVGTRVPDVTVQGGFPEPYVNIPERVAGKQVLLVGLPGAFTPTCSSVQVPGYLENQDSLKMRGVDEIIVVCVNDGAVMSAWATDQGIDGSMITFLADPNANLISALGMELTAAGPVNKLGPKRSKRFAAYIDNGEIKVFRTSEGDGDPAGDDDPAGTCWDAMAKAIDALPASGKEL